MLAAVEFGNPLLWAVFIGWIMSVVLHEFAHGLVALWGGDYTIRERGGLTLNPLQYVDPLNSLIIPMVIFLIGGVPLPGGVTYVRNDLLRSRLWESLVSLAGPVANVLLLFACLLPLQHGWVSMGPSAAESSNAAVFLGAMVMLQALSVLINLIPVPPLDGFGIIRPYFHPEFQQRVNQPQVALFGIFAVFIVLSGTGLVPWFFGVFERAMLLAGVDEDTVLFLPEAFNRALFAR
jgi:Zn-dependent protease